MKSLFNGRYVINSLGQLFSCVDTHGRIRPIPKPMKVSTKRSGYFNVVLVIDIDGKPSKVCKYIHRLVAQAFIDNPDNKPEVNHINGIKTDNRAVNLEWVSKSENALHAYKLNLRTAGLGGTGKFNELHPKSKPVNQLTMDGVFIKRFPSLQEARRSGFSQGNISSVINGRRKHCGGFKWEYAT